MPSQQDFVDSILPDSHGFADCPDWTVADLVWHLREVHYAWGVIVTEGLVDPRGITPIERPPDFSVLLADFCAGAQRLGDILAAADPARTVWTWAPRKDAAFVVRHQVQETA